MAVNLRKVLASQKAYDRTFGAYYRKVQEDYDSKNRSVTIEIGDESIRMRVSEFLVNLILWKPFLRFRKPFDRSFVFDTSRINADAIGDYLDRVISKFLTEDNQIQLNECISEIIEELGWFSLDFNMIMGNSINLYDKIQLAKRNPRYNELIHRKFDEGTPSIEVERQIAEDVKELIGILETEDNCFRPYLRAKEGINRDQLSQFEINIGPKPDLKGNVFPKFANTNFLVDGLRSPSDYFIDASGGRKAAIINFGQVKKAGYTTRKLSLLCMNTLLDYSVRDCGTENYMRITVANADVLKRLNGRWYSDGERERMIDAEADSGLIGKEILLRSPVTCKGERICRKCYGNLSMINNDIHVGLLGVVELTSQLTQMMLSAKHLLKTDSEVIKWPDQFMEIFSLDANAVVVNPALDNEGRFSLVIEEANINENEEASSVPEDEDDGEEFSKSIRKFAVEVRSRKSSKVLSMESEKELYFSPYLEELLKTKAVKDGDTYTLSFRDIEMGEPLFFIEIENNELSRHLHNILNLIDSKGHLDVTTKEQMLEKFLELLGSSRIKLDSVHAECIIRELIRTPGDRTRRPDFGKKDPEYVILRVWEAILESPSVIVSLAFEKHKKQLYEPSTYRKTAPSLLDRIFQ